MKFKKLKNKFKIFRIGFGQFENTYFFRIDFGHKGWRIATINSPDLYSTKPIKIPDGMSSDEFGRIVEQELKKMMNRRINDHLE